jgi:hypothetical protein
MAFTVGINKNIDEMFGDLETLLTSQGWNKEMSGNISSMESSKGNIYIGTAKPMPGKYSSTTGFKCYPGQYLTHKTYTTQGSAPDVFFSPMPTEFSVTMQVNFAEYISSFVDYYQTVGAGSYKNVSNISGFTFSGKMGFFLFLNKKYPAIWDEICTTTALEMMDVDGVTKCGKEYFLLTFTFSNTSKVLNVYVNDVNTFTCTLRGFPGSTTKYPAIWRFDGTNSITIDQLITWNKVLTPSEVLALVNKSTPVVSTDPYVYEIFNHKVNKAKGGYYSKLLANGSKLYISILVNSSDNIELNSYTFGATETLGIYNLPIDNRVPKVTGASGSPRVLACVSNTSSALKKYWIVVTDSYVSLNYKLHDTTSARATPLYQSGYIGIISTLGNEANNIFISGTTTTTTYLWTTVSSTTFRSGYLYASNNLYRLGYSGYVNASVGSTTASISSLQNIINSVFMANVTAYYGASVIGVIPGVSVISKNQASAEDIITINSVDHIVLDDGDASTANNYRLAIKLN